MKSLPPRSSWAIGLMVLAGCVDGVTPTAPESGRVVSVAAAPHFSIAPSMAVIARLDRARLVLIDTVSDSVVAIEERVIDPAEDEWAFDLTVAVPEGRPVNLRLEVELIDRDGTFDLVEFSGRTTFDAVASLRTEVREIALGRGPLANLDLTAIQLRPGRTRLLEGASDVLAVDTVGAKPGQIIFYESLDPSTAMVDPAGIVRARGPGDVAIIARAGHVADTLHLGVDMVTLPSQDEVRRLLAAHLAFVTSEPFLASFSDRAAAVELGGTLTVVMDEMLAGRGSGAVKGFEDALDRWQRYGEQSGLRPLDGVQLGFIALAMMHAADAMGVDFP